MDTAFKEYLVGRGIESGLAAALADNYGDWAALTAEREEVIRERFGTQAMEGIARAKGRREIPAPTVRKLTGECDWGCCYCWNVDRKVGVVIHHIEEHAARPDDSFENLIVLCPNHHSEVHRKYEIARHPYSPDALRERKSRFAAAIAAFRAGTGPAPGREAVSVGGRAATAPLPPITFTGRTDSLSAVGTCLSSGPRRCALVGMGGVGKTALALKAIQSHSALFAGGMFWLEHDDGDATIRRLLRSLISALGGDDSGLDEESQNAFAQSLLAGAGEKQTLLVAIDGASEQNLAGLVRLFSGLPRSVAVLVTTRDLAVAAALGAEALQVAPMVRAESQELLAVHGGARAGNNAERQRLLALLGDLPLALELVAKQVALRALKPGFSVAAVCDQLARFDETLLSFPGHRGLAMSFALSYGGMDASEQRLFRSLGAFAEGPTAAPSVAAVAGMDAAAAETTLDRLVSISVLHWHPLPSHYQAHPLILKYAEHLLGLAAINERNEVRKNFCSHFIAAANAIAERDPLDFRAMDAIYANYTKAMFGAAHDGENLQVARSMSIMCLSRYFDRRNLDREILPLLEVSAGCAEKTSELNLYAELTSHRGRACLRLGRIAQAIPIYERATEITRKTGNDMDLSSNLQNLGQALVTEGTDLPRAERLLNEALRLSEKATNSDAYAATCTSLGGLYRQIGRMDLAARMYEQGLQFSRLFGNRYSVGNNLSNLGLVHLETGNLAKAEGEIREALAIAREVGDPRGEGNRTGHLGRIMLMRAEGLKVGLERQRLMEHARSHFEAALAVAKETDDPEKQAMWQMNLGVLHYMCRRGEEAMVALRAAMGIAAECGSSKLEGQIALNAGTILAEAGKFRESMEMLRHARQLLARVNSSEVAQVDQMIEALARASR